MGRDIRSIIVGQALVVRDVTNGMQGEAADLSGAFGDVVGHLENLFGLLIEQEMVVSKMRAAHVPVKVLGLHKKSEHIGKQMAEAFRDFNNRIGII